MKRHSVSPRSVRQTDGLVQGERLFLGFLSRRWSSTSPTQAGLPGLPTKDLVTRPIYWLFYTRVRSCGRIDVKVRVPLSSGVGHKHRRGVQVTHKNVAMKRVNVEQCSIQKPSLFFLTSSEDGFLINFQNKNKLCRLISVDLKRVLK